MTVVMSLALTFCCGTAAMSALGRFAQPLPNDGSGFVGIALGQFADPVHGLGVDLALDLGNVDQLGGAAGAGDQGLIGSELSVRPVTLDQDRRRFGTGN